MADSSSNQTYQLSRPQIPPGHLEDMKIGQDADGDDAEQRLSRRAGAHAFMLRRLGNEMRGIEQNNTDAHCM